MPFVTVPKFSCILSAMNWRRAIRIALPIMQYLVVAGANFIFLVLVLAVFSACLFVAGLAVGDLGGPLWPLLALAAALIYAVVATIIVIPLCLMLEIALRRRLLRWAWTVVPGVMMIVLCGATAVSILLLGLLPNPAQTPPAGPLVNTCAALLVTWLVLCPIFSFWTGLRVCHRIFNGIGRLSKTLSPGIR